MSQAGTAALPPLPSPFVVHDPEFEAVTGESPRLSLVVEADAHEGPVYVPAEDALYFTSMPRAGHDPLPGTPVVAVRRLALDGHRFPLRPERITTVVEDANVANGMTLDREGRLIACEQGTRNRLARIAYVAPSETIVDHFRGLPLNSPNDVVVRRDGTIWFTDPSYGHLQGFRCEPLLGDFVYRHDPASGETEVAAHGFDKPNGLCFSPDERVLYVADNGSAPHVRTYDVDGDGRLRRERLFAVGTPGNPDGMKCDDFGRLFATSLGGIRVYSPTARLLGEIRLPGAVNFTFGGPHRDILFVTRDDSIWAVQLATTGPTGAS